MKTGWFLQDDGEVESLLLTSGSEDGEESSDGGGGGSSSDLDDSGGAAAGQTVEQQATWRAVLPAIWPSVAAAYVSFTHGLLVVCLLPYVPAEHRPGVSDDLAGEVRTH